MLENPSQTLPLNMPRSSCIFKSHRVALVILIISNHGVLLCFVALNSLTFKLSTGNSSAGMSFFPLYGISRGMVLKETSDIVNSVIKSPGLECGSPEGRCHTSVLLLLSCC